MYLGRALSILDSRSVLLKSKALRRFQHERSRVVHPSRVIYERSLTVHGRHREGPCGGAGVRPLRGLGRRGPALPGGDGRGWSSPVPPFRGAATRRGRAHSLSSVFRALGGDSLPVSALRGVWFSRVRGRTRGPRTLGPFRTPT